MDLQDRFENERNIWLASAREDGRPHLVPIWFVWHEDVWYICTHPDSAKAKNMLHQPVIQWSLENGDDPFVVEGTAEKIAAPSQTIIDLFQNKFDWNITTDGYYSQVFALTITRRISWKQH